MVEVAGVEIGYDVSEYSVPHRLRVRLGSTASMPRASSGSNWQEMTQIHDTKPRQFPALNMEAGGRCAKAGGRSRNDGSGTRIIFGKKAFLSAIRELSL